jgi:hypothetical protein
MDKLVRNGQDRQTLGIPIGPDTSLLIAEIVLSAVDVALERSGPVNGFRYIDDYEIACDSLSDADSVCARLQEALSEFELALNPAKTHILDLPLPLQEAAFSELRVLRLRRNRVAQRSDLLRFFDRAFVLSRAEPDQHVMNYAIGRIAHSTVDQSNWPCLQDLLLHAAVTAPSSLRLVLDELWRYRELGYPLDGQKVALALNNIISEHAVLNHGNEVGWAVWGLLVLDEQLSSVASASAARSNDSIVALLLLHAHQKGLVPGGAALGAYIPFMRAEELYGQQWLLSYEANVKGWLPSAGGAADHVAADPCFSYLKQNGVEFYDSAVLGLATAAPSGFAAYALFPSGTSRAARAAPVGDVYE